MRFDTSQHMKLGQQMKLAPRMIQSMEILQMSLADLEERVEQELENNATLERAEPESGLSPENAEPRLDEHSTSEADDFERLSDFSADNPEAVDNEFAERGNVPDTAAEREPWDRALDSMERGLTRPRSDGERDAKMDAMASAPARSISLTEQLREQWALSDVKPEFRADGELIISFLDDDGYLRTPLETIADRVPSDRPRPSVEQLTRALQAVQLFLEPAGIAARDARECLLLQIDALLAGDADGPDEPELSGVDHADQREVLRHVRLLVDRHLDDLMQNRLPRISEKTGLSLDQIRAALVRMKRLSLAPGRRLVDDAPGSITPDAIVEYDADADRYVAYLNDRRMPGLRVNQEYARLAKDKTLPQKDREFLKTNLSNAHWLIDAVQQRQSTLLRVVNAVIAAQREYFDYGPQALKPLPMTQVAEQMGVHVATVSRAVAEKYIQTPRGVVPLRKFFSGGTQTDAGEDVSWDAIKAALRDVIDAEDKAKPLSDEALVEELKKRGIEIARRTIAKYREQMGIPAARLRKTY